MIYLAMETDPTLEFDHFLGVELGKTLEEIGAMSMVEYSRWVVYYGRKAQREQIAAAQQRARR